VTTGTEVPRGIAAMAIGAALGTAIVISGPVIGAGVNPAQAIADDPGGPVHPTGGHASRCR
jgi:glycerol uptake facilitator-like aquaporin